MPRIPRYSRRRSPDSGQLPMSAADRGAGIEARGLAGMAQDVAGGVGNIAEIAERMEIRRAETEYISTKALQSRLNAEFLDDLRRQPVPENVTDPQKYYQETFNAHIKSLHSLSANRATTARSKRAIENMTMEETERLRGEVMKLAWGKEQDRSLAMLEASTNEYWQAYLLTGDVRNIARIGASIHMMFENGVIDATTKTKMLLDWDKKYQVELVRREITAAVNDPDNPKAQERVRQAIEDYPGPEREKMQFRDEYRIDTHIAQRQREELAVKDIDEVMGMAMNMDMSIENIQAEIEARENLSPTKKVEAFRLATWAYDLWRGKSINPFVETQNHISLAEADFHLDHDTGEITSLQDIEDRWSEGGKVNWNLTEKRRLIKKFQDMQKPTKLEQYSASHTTAKQYFYRLDRLYREEGTGAYDGDVKGGRYKEYNNKRFALEKVLMQHWGNSEMMEKEFEELVKPKKEEEAKRTLKQFMRDWLFTFSPAAATLRRKPVVDELIQKNEPKDENPETPKALPEPDDEDDFLQTVQTIPDDAQARAYYNQWEHKFR